MGGEFCVCADTIPILAESLEGEVNAVTRFAGCALVLVLTAATAAAVAGQTDSVEFKGTVRTTDGKALSGVTVVISYYPQQQMPVSGPRSQEEVSALSDARGRFTLTVPTPLTTGRLRVETPPTSRMRLWSVTPPDALTRLRTQVRETVQLDVRMNTGSETLSGKVTDEADKPVKGVTVRIRHVGRTRSLAGGALGEQYLEATTDARGVYRVRHLLVGQYSVDSVVPERGSGLVPMPKSWRGHGGVELPSKRASGLDFTLKRGCGIRGRVLDEAGKPVKGARVAAGLAPAAIDGPVIYQRLGNFKDSVETDSAGRYALEGLTPETYEVSASGPEGSDFAPSHPLAGLKLEVGKALTCQDIVLVQGGTLEGTVTGSDGKPVAGVSVQYGQRFAETDERGRYRFTALPTGTFDLTLLPPAGSKWAARTVEGVPCMAKIRVASDWTLVEGGTVSGKVTGEDGNAISGVRVHASFTGYRYATTTDEAGRYRLTGLVENSGVDYKKRPQLYSLGVYTPADSEYMSGSAKFNIKLGEEITQDVTLKRGGIISGEVTGVGGVPVEGASIEVYKTVGRGGRSYFGGTGPGPGGGLRTDADGKFVVKQIPDGWVSVSATPPEDVNLLMAERSNIGVGAGETTTVKLTLKPGGKIAGTLEDPNGTPIHGAQVTLTSSASDRRRAWGRQIRPVTTDERGSYRFVGLQEGPYRLQVRILDGKHVASPMEVEVRAGEETAAKIRARKGAFIEVKVKDGAGKPVPNVSVRATAKTKGIGSVYAQADKSGLALVGPLLPDTYTVNVNPYRTKERTLKPAVLGEITVREGQRVRREVKLEEGPKPTPPRGGRGGPLGAPPGAGG